MKRGFRFDSFEYVFIQKMEGNQMKKLFALLLAAAMILSMAACGSGTSSGNNATTPNETNGEAVTTDGTANDPTALNLSGKKLVIGT